MICVVDVETTGLRAETDRVCELAGVVITDNEIETHRSSIVNPGIPIPIVASAVHHLTDKDVVDARSLEEAVDFVIPGGVKIYAAHNSPFDRSFLQILEPALWIDTCACARHLYPESPTYSNQVLRYYLGVEPKLSNVGREGQPHSALYDALTTAEILLCMLKENTVEDLLKLSGTPILLKSMPFGKHKGSLFSEVPKDYLEWLRGRPDLSADLKYTLDHHVK